MTGPEEIPGEPGAAEAPSDEARSDEARSDERPVPPSPPRRPRGVPSDRGDRIRRALSSESDLGDLFLLSELIGPPLGLREGKWRG